MVQLIVGSKGSGKTKALVKMVEDSAAKSMGNVVCIEKGDSLKFGLSHKIRLIDIEEYSVSGPDSYYGFIAGLMAGNYDITDIYGDATFKVLCGKDSKDCELLATFVEKLNALLGNHSMNVIFTVSCDPADLPERIKGFIKQ
jgi:hypothetical protein